MAITSQVETTGTRRTVTKLALTGVAILGVGAALTSAAWSDDVWFGGDAETAPFELEGSIDGINWFEADDSGDSISMNVGGVDAFANVGPGVGDSTTLYLRNAGGIPIYLSSIDFDTTGALFSGPLAAGVAHDLVINEVLLPEADTEVVVTVTGHEDWDNSYTGVSGSLTVQIVGSSDDGTP